MLGSCSGVVVQGNVVMMISTYPGRLAGKKKGMGSTDWDFRAKK
jgi:hypothetical protein